MMRAGKYDIATYTGTAAAKKGPRPDHGPPPAKIGKPSDHAAESEPKSPTGICKTLRIGQLHFGVGKTVQAYTTIPSASAVMARMSRFTACLLMRLPVPSNAGDKLRDGLARGVRMHGP